MSRAMELVWPTLVGRWSSFWSVVCAMCWLMKHLLLVVVAVQLAAPAGWCCKLTPVAACHTETSVRRCCAHHGPSQSPLPVSVNFCCCPKAATLAKSVAAPARSESASALLFDWNVPSPESGWATVDRSLRYSQQSVDRRIWSRQVELCVWLC